MKTTGITRKIDGLGRIVIPKEIRRVLNIKEDVDYIEIFTENDTVVLRKYEQTCIFCGSHNDVIKYKGHCICPSCVKEIASK